jgi:hypothetical protein
MKNIMEVVHQIMICKFGPKWNCIESDETMEFFLEISRMSDELIRATYHKMRRDTSRFAVVGG